MDITEQPGAGTLWTAGLCLRSTEVCVARAVNVALQTHCRGAPQTPGRAPGLRSWLPEALRCQPDQPVRLCTSFPESSPTTCSRLSFQQLTYIRPGGQRAGDQSLQGLEAETGAQTEQTRATKDWVLTIGPPLPGPLQVRACCALTLPQCLPESAHPHALGPTPWPQGL